MMRWILVSVWMLVFGWASGLEARSVRAVATTTMVAEMVRSVGGDAVEVTGLMGPGVDPHLYRPNRRDVTALQRADIIFYNGLYLEGRMTEVLEAMQRRGRVVHAVAEAVDTERLLRPAEYEGAPDPHIWFDPTLWSEAVPGVVEALSRIDPERAQEFARRGKLLQEALLELDGWARQRIAQLPVEKRVLITSHDAYNYFGRAYDFQVIGVQGLSTVSEAGLADMVRIVEYIRKHEVRAVFIETSVSPRLIQRISEDSGAVIGGELFSDAMGVPGQIETFRGDSYDVGTYAGMVKHNVNHIVAGLLGEKAE